MYGSQYINHKMCASTRLVSTTPDADGATVHIAPADVLQGYLLSSRTGIGAGDGSPPPTPHSTYMPHTQCQPMAALPAFGVLLQKRLHVRLQRNQVLLDASGSLWADERLALRAEVFCEK